MTHRSSRLAAGLVVTVALAAAWALLGTPPPSDTELPSAPEPSVGEVEIARFAVG